MRRRRLRIGAALLLGFATAACGSGDPAGGPPPPEVQVATAVVGTVPDRREHVGHVRAVQQVDVRARVRGYLIERRFDEGRMVAAGDVLFRIDPSSYEVALAQAEGQHARAVASARRAALDYDRAQELFAKKVVAKSGIDAARAERDATAADVAAAEAAVREAKLNLSWCEVRAPFAGRIGRALVDVGNLVGESGQDTVLARIVQIDPIHVHFAPTERDRLDVLRGEREGRIPADRASGAIPIEVRLGDGTRYPHDGTIDFVDPSIEDTRGTVAVRALLPNPEGTLKPGEFVRVTVVFPDRPDVVLVPQRAVLDEQGGAYVLVVDAQDTAVYRRVVPGVVHDGLQQIVEGLAAGERVIADGMQKARPGTKVIPQPLEPAPAQP
jgi:RND family efflux transporter MFP subunit